MAQRIEDYALQTLGDDVAALVDAHVTVEGLTSVDTFGATGNLTTGVLQGCTAALLAIGSAGVAWSAHNKERLLANGDRWEREIAKNLELDAPYR